MPELAAELTLQPVRRYGVDAAILFSDIVVPLAAIGVGVEVVPGRGPVIDPPFRTGEDLKRLRPLEPEADLAHVLETIRIVVGEVDVPLIGFAGAPFTLASYLIEGGPSRTFARTKALMHGEPELWHQLADRLADLALAALRAQVEAGASAIQLFDSWAGALSPDDYATFALAGLAQGARGDAQISASRGFISASAPASCSASCRRQGPTWSASTGACRFRSPARRIGPGKAVQGNLDPAFASRRWPS